MTPFGDTLKTWRKRRRLSQLDLAGEAEVSSRHISFLESGRSRPSRGMVLRLAQRMDLPHSARNDLLTAAGFAPAAAPARHDDALAPVREALSWTLQAHMPYPAYAVDRYWHILEMNATATRMLGAVGLGVGESLVEHLLSNAALGAALVNYDEVLRHSLARLRTEAAHFGADPKLEDWVKRLSAVGVESDAPLPAIVPSIYRLGPQTLS
ncbi:MAG: helix-turn-helix transcriptional regulator, partial [Pseudomonadota bacterium]